MKKAVDLTVAQDAMKLLLHFGPADQPHLFAAIRGGRCTHAMGIIDELWPWLSAQNNRGCDVYYLPQAVKRKRRRHQDITGIRALFLDFDEGGLAADLPCIDGAIVVETSSGRFQVVWPIPPISVFDFHAYIGGLLNRFPSADRRAKDEARLLRLPGLKNTKHGRDRFLARTVRERARNLTSDDLASFPRDDAYAMEILAKRSRSRAPLVHGSGTRMEGKPACSIEKAGKMTQTIIKALRKGGEHRLTVRMQDGCSWEADIKKNRPWRKLAVSLIVAVGNVEAALPMIDTLSRGDYLGPRSREDVRAVYDWARNLSIYEGILSPADFVELTGKAAVTHKTFNATYQAARKVLGVTKAVHARSNEVMVAIKAGRADGERIATETRITIILETRPGNLRDFLLEIWGNLTRGGNKRYAFTGKAKIDLMARMGINGKALANLITKAGAFYAIAPGRFDADRTVYIGWLDNPNELAADLARESLSGARHDVSLSTSEVTSSPKEIVLFCPEHGSNENGRKADSPISQMLHRSHPASEYRWTAVDEVGLKQLQVLARTSTDTASESGFWRYLVEKGVVDWRVEEALLSAMTRDEEGLASATKRAAQTHAVGVGSEIWHICRSRTQAARLAADVIARANTSLLCRVANRNLDAEDARSILESYRSALARKAWDFEIWTPGADRLQRQAQWRGPKSAETVGNDTQGGLAPERSARGASKA